ncbi:IS4 family transposase [Chryseobacterium capnotolerans]|uniref:IS4 family transposase n=1 Tax=Chryseobacterium TaxID=59732 RepID=UPI00083B7A07|nr:MULTISPECIES: IS4 family transposase [Chryseobacterium]UHO36816.1 IS4 family transposase [Chryseobacterium capnotolerans]UHO36857.1 IS4 family transposase [Chryseobacterium capnotolerans]UHO38594.1 IS4 family transposase [Chryseobacterium capnotolerans]UHO39287.1 IS4 family transposase [Chryseobacterium capnotolerans]UHO39391.1 IS4 family transposase [Chryseobacterium capnotolerans]
MSIFSEHKISVSQLLSFIPEALLSHLSANTKVDHYSKVLQGRKMFYLLLFAITSNEKLSQRTLEDTFKDPVFKALFNLDETETVRRSSISERLSKIDSRYFKEIYDCIYNMFCDSYNPAEREKYDLIRTDSTVIGEAAGKLKEGIAQNGGKKFIKYSVLFDGLLPCGVEIYNTPKYCAEDNALSEAVLQHVKREKEHANIYIIDKGLGSAQRMKEFDDKGVFFVIRSKENRKHEEIKSFIEKDQNIDLGEIVLIKDSLVKLYSSKPVPTQKGKTYNKEEQIETHFRLVVVSSKQQPEKEFWFLTNDFQISAKDIADYYRKRWDIEVFFRFLKQELHASHLLSLNKNGIEVMIYMTLITAMLILIYKKANNIGYKTAKRRFAMEIRNLAISILIIGAGGNPDKVFKT